MNLSSSSSYSQKNQSAYMTLQNVRILLDEIPYPCLLINVSSGKILLSNNRFNELTQFSVSEIIGAGIEKYSRGIDLFKWEDGFAGAVFLKRRNNTDLETEAKISYIDQISETALISFINKLDHYPMNNAMRTFLKHQSNLFNDWENLSSERLIKDLVSVSQELFEPDKLIFYLPASEQRELYRYENRKDEFPENLIPIEIERIGNIDHWEPGKRVLTDIHRAGRAAHYRSILSFSFDWYSLGKGLGVLAFQKSIDLDLMKALLSGISGWISSITNQLQIKELLKEKNLNLKYRNDLLEGIFENTNDALVVLNRHEKIVHFNDNFCNLFSYSPIELLNRKWEVIFGGSAQSNFNKIKELNIQNEKKDVISLLDRNGKPIPVSLKLLKFDDDDLKYMLIIQSAVDRITSEEQKRSLEKKASLGEVVADFAHEVRNPINNISTGLQLILQDLPEEDENLLVINRMQEDCIRINYLMESILSFSRQDNKQFQELDLCKLLRKISYQLMDKFEKKGHELKLMCDLDNAVIIGDQRSIEQVVINLANNSSEALSDESGIIGLKLEQSDEYPDFFKITISDTGPGIPGNVEERLFQPFVSDKPKGTGLGLAIAKRIVDSHEGLINVETFPGGTIFEIFVPKKVKGEYL